MDEGGYTPKHHCHGERMEGEYNRAALCRQRQSIHSPFLRKPTLTFLLQVQHRSSRNLSVCTKQVANEGVWGHVMCLLHDSRGVEAVKPPAGRGRLCADCCRRLQVHAAAFLTTAICLHSSTAAKLPLNFMFSRHAGRTASASPTQPPREGADGPIFVLGVWGGPAFGLKQVANAPSCLPAVAATAAGERMWSKTSFSPPRGSRKAVSVAGWTAADSRRS